jgi:hypothetical protein
VNVGGHGAAFLRRWIRWRAAALKRTAALMR